MHDDVVYLFKGDSFGIDLHITNEVIHRISYQADTNKAAVSLRFIHRWTPMGSDKSVGEPESVQWKRLGATASRICVYRCPSVVLVL